MSTKINKRKAQNAKRKVRTQNLKFLILNFSFTLYVLSFTLTCYAAPCYGTNMPGEKKIHMGLGTHTIFKRYLEDQWGKMKSSQEFLLVSYGIRDWLSLDLKGGAGYIKQHPVGKCELDYPTFLGGGYGFRLKLYDTANTRIVFGFQHISIHPETISVEGAKHKAVLDDWQFSALASYSLKRITPYLGTKWSRTDYIHWVDSVRNRVRSDLTRSVGLVLGLDILATEKAWVNLEGQFFDAEALAFSLNYKF